MQGRAAAPPPQAMLSLLFKEYNSVVFFFLGTHHQTPKKVDALTGKGVKKMLCGSQFSMALTDKGHVYTW